MASVVHVDLPVDDLVRAKKLYGSIFGWKLDDVPGMEYTSVITAEVDEKTSMPLKPVAQSTAAWQRGRSPAANPSWR